MITLHIPIREYQRSDSSMIRVTTCVPWPIRICIVVRSYVLLVQWLRGPRNVSRGLIKSTSCVWFICVPWRIHATRRTTKCIPRAGASWGPPIPRRTVIRRNSGVLCLLARAPRMPLPVNICTHICTHMYVCVFTYVYVYTYANIYICMHIYVDMYMNVNAGGFFHRVYVWLHTQYKHKKCKDICICTYKYIYIMCIYAQYECTHYKCMYILLYICMYMYHVYIHAQHIYTYSSRSRKLQFLTPRHKCMQARNPTAQVRSLEMLDPLDPPKTACLVLLVRPRPPRSRWVLLVRRPRMELMVWSGRRTSSAAVALTISRGVRCVRVNVFVYVFNFACFYVKISRCICTHIYFISIHAHIHTYICTYMYIYIYICTCTCIYAYLYRYIRMHTQIYMYICTHSHTYHFIYRPSVTVSALTVSHGVFVCECFSFICLYVYIHIHT